MPPSVENKPLIAALTAIVGPQGLLSEAADMAPFLQDWRGIYVGQAAAVVRPANRDELSKVVALCAQQRIIVVPQGGNTGMCGAATPSSDQVTIVICLSRMNRIVNVDALNNTMTVEAGALLDLFTGVFVMGIVINHIHMTFDSTDTGFLAELKD